MPHFILNINPNLISVEKKYSNDAKYFIADKVNLSMGNSSACLQNTSRQNKLDQLEQRV